MKVPVEINKYFYIVNHLTLKFKFKYFMIFFVKFFINNKD